MIVKRCIALAGLLLPSLGWAGVGWTDYRTVLDVVTTSTGTEITLQGSNGACTNTSGNTWAKIEVGQANEKQFMALLLTAFASGKTVNIYCDSSAAWAPVAYLRVQGS